MQLLGLEQKQDTIKFFPLFIIFWPSVEGNEFR